VPRAGKTVGVTKIPRSCCPDYHVFIGLFAPQVRDLNGLRTVSIRDLAGVKSKIGGFGLLYVMGDFSSPVHKCTP
jgi:hypothetical protein